MPRLYSSRPWLYKRYIVDKVAIPDIAAECGVDQVTIYRNLEKHGIIKKR